MKDYIYWWYLRILYNILKFIQKFLYNRHIGWHDNIFNECCPDFSCCENNNPFIYYIEETYNKPYLPLATLIYDNTKEEKSFYVYEKEKGYKIRSYKCHKMKGFLNERNNKNTK